MPLTLNGSGTITGFSSTQEGLALTLITAQSFSAVSTVNVNNCFTSTYNNYNMVLEVTGSTSLNIDMRMRANGVDDSTSNYFVQYIQATSGTNATARLSSQTSGLITTSISANGAFAVWNISSPAVSAPTRWVGSCSPMTTATTPEYISNNTTHMVSSAFDGFSLITSTGTITGTLRIYGYRN